MSTATPSTENTLIVNDVEIDFDPKAAIQEIAKNWGWILAAGIVSVIGGAAALMAPVFATGVVGTFVGVNMIMSGAARIAKAIEARKFANAATE